MRAASSVHIHPSFAWGLTNDAAAEGREIQRSKEFVRPKAKLLPYKAEQFLLAGFDTPAAYCTTQQKKGKAIHIDFPHIK